MIKANVILDHSKWKNKLTVLIFFIKLFVLFKNNKNSIKTEKIIVPIKLLCKNGIAMV